jgi:anti-sigma factor RsiW
MFITTFLPRHRLFRSQIDAFADGQLPEHDRAALQRHIDACERCASALDSTRSLTATLGALPEVRAARSFRLTADMVSRPSPAPVRPTPARNPVYLGLARASAAIVVVAFVSVFAYSSVRDSGDSQAPTAARESSPNDIQPVSAQDSGPGSESPNLSDKSAPAATPAPLLVPGSTGVSGASAQSPVGSDSPGAAYSQPDATGAGAQSQVPPDEANPTALSSWDAAGVAPYAATSSKSGSGGEFPWAAALGGAALLSVLVLAGAEYWNRRSRRV